MLTAYRSKLSGSVVVDIARFCSDNLSRAFCLCYVMCKY